MASNYVGRGKNDVDEIGFLGGTGTTEDESFAGNSPNTQFLGEDYYYSVNCTGNDRSAAFDFLPSFPTGSCAATEYIRRQISLKNGDARRKQQEDESSLIMTEGFDKLSVEEREQALAELHGVVDNLKESPELVESSLGQLETEISKIKDRRSAYDRAMFLSPQYVSNRDFRLMFLRCERYNAQKAAVRLIKHFETKLELFGLDRLGRDVRFDDLDEDAATMYMTGSQWFTKHYDRSGRRLYLITLERTTFRKAINYVSWKCRNLSVFLFCPIARKTFCSSFVSLIRIYTTKVLSIFFSFPTFYSFFSFILSCHSYGCFGTSAWLQQKMYRHR